MYQNLSIIMSSMYLGEKVNKFLQSSLFLLLFLWCFKDRRKMKGNFKVWLRSAVFCENINCTGVPFFLMTQKDFLFA